MDYHHLARLKDILENSQMKSQIVDADPQTAVRLFYYFDDREIGAMVVDQYAVSQNGDLRELAQRVVGVIQARELEDKRNESLEYVLNMRGTLLEPKFAARDEQGNEGFRESAVRAYEDRRESLIT